MREIFIGMYTLNVIFCAVNFGLAFRGESFHSMAGWFCAILGWVCAILANL